MGRGNTEYSEPLINYSISTGTMKTNSGLELGTSFNGSINLHHQMADISLTGGLSQIPITDLSQIELANSFSIKGMVDFGDISAYLQFNPDLLTGLNVTRTERTSIGLLEIEANTVLDISNFRTTQSFALYWQPFNQPVTVGLNGSFHAVNFNKFNDPNINVTVSGSFAMQGTEIVDTSIKGTIFHDTNRDGVKNAGERGTPNTIILLKQNDQIIKKYNTGVTGSYEFGQLEPGDYTIIIKQSSLPHKHRLLSKKQMTIGLSRHQIETINFAVVKNKIKEKITFSQPLN